MVQGSVDGLSATSAVCHSLDTFGVSFRWRNTKRPETRRVSGTTQDATPDTPATMPRLVSLIALALACALAITQPAAAALGDGWPSVSAARRAVARLTGGGAVGALCAVSNCERPAPLPSPPGGKFAKFGPYDTRLVYLDSTQTSRYGFPSAVVACPVLPEERESVTPKSGQDSGNQTGQNFVAAAAAAAGAFLGTYVPPGWTFAGSYGTGGASSIDEDEEDEKKTLKLPKKVPGLAWSHGGQGS